MVWQLDDDMTAARLDAAVVLWPAGVCQSAMACSESLVVDVDVHDRILTRRNCAVDSLQVSLRA